MGPPVPEVGGPAFGRTGSGGKGGRSGRPPKRGGKDFFRVFFLKNLFKFFYFFPYYFSKIPQNLFKHFGFFGNIKILQAFLNFIFEFFNCWRFT